MNTGAVQNAMDVRTTVEKLDSAGIRVHNLALGGVNLTSPAGKMTIQVISAIAEFERDLLIERTQAGLKRAKGRLSGVLSHSSRSSKQRPSRAWKLGSLWWAIKMLHVLAVICHRRKRPVGPGWRDAGPDRAIATEPRFQLHCPTRLGADEQRRVGRCGRNGRHDRPVSPQAQAFPLRRPMTLTMMSNRLDFTNA